MKSLRGTESKLIVDQIKESFFEVLLGFLPEGGIAEAIQY